MANNYKNSIFYSLLQVKKKLMESIQHQDQALLNVCLNTADELSIKTLAEVEDFTNAAYDYQVTTDGSIAYNISKLTGSTIVTYECLTEDGLAATASLNHLTQTASDAIDWQPVSPTINIQPAFSVNDICTYISTGESMNETLVNINEKFLTTTNISTSDIIGTIDNVKTCALDDKTKLKQMVFDCSVDGKLSNYSWVGILNNLCTKSAKDMEDSGGFDLDRSSPFTLRTFIQTVLTVISSVFSVLVTVIIGMLRGLAAILFTVVSVAANLLSKISSDRITASDGSNDYLKGTVFARDDLPWNTTGFADNSMNARWRYKDVDSSEVSLQLWDCGLMDLYIWPTNPSDVANSRANINGYVGLKYNIERFIKLLGDYLFAYSEEIFGSVSFPSCPWNGGIGQAWDYNIDMSYIMGSTLSGHSFIEYLDMAEGVDGSIYLTPAEIARCKVDSNYCTWAFTGSLMVGLFLGLYCMVNDSSCKIMYSGTGRGDMVMSGNGDTTAQSGYSLPDEYKTQFRAIDSILVHAMWYEYYKLQGAADCDKYALAPGYTGFSTNYSVMTSWARSAIMDVITRTSASDFYSTDCSRTFNTLTRQTDTGINRLNCYPSLIARDSSIIVSLGQHGSITYNGGIDTVLYREPEEIDFLPSNGTISIPDFSTADVVAAVATVAILVGATIMGAKMISRSLKARKQIKMTKRQNELTNLRKAWTDNPDDDEAKQNYTKAVKSYNAKAAFFNWPTYDAANNWMDYSTSSSAVVTSGSGIIESLSGLYQNENKIDDVSDGVEDVIKLIK